MSLGEVTWLREVEVVCLSPTSEGGQILSVEDLCALDEAEAFDLEHVEEEVQGILEALPVRIEVILLTSSPEVLL